MTIDPKLHHCKCGMTWKPKTYHKIIMLVRGEYTRKCPRCGAVMKFRLIGHVVKVSSKKVLDEEIWKNG